MKGYGEYKDSTVAWIGNVPIRWDISPIHRVASLNSGKAAPVEGNKGEYPFAVYGSGGKFKYTNNYIHDGEAVLFGRKGTLGIPIYTKSKFWAVDTVYFAVCRHGIASKLLFYIFQIFPWVEHATKTALPSIVGRTVFRSKIPVPPREEQDQIVRYLDAKVGKINNLIRIKQKQTALLKEKKQAIINQAVTKGLDPNAPMKDSGIAWIGQIPEGWTVERLKFLMGKIVDCPHETPHYSADGTYFVIRTADQDYGFLRDAGKMYRLDSQEYQQRIRRERLLKDDIVYGREGERWGLACLVPESDMFCLGQRMMQFRCNSGKIIPQFAVWMLNAQYIYRQGTLDTLGSTSPHVNIATIKNYYCILPNIEVQESISRYVNEVSCGAENLIKNVESKIAALTEYRTRLISDVVTGKVDVRHIPIDDADILPEMEADLTLEDESDDSSIMAEE